MSTSRKRNFIATAGRLTAVTLSVALLAGCTGARFMMGGDAAPVNPTGVQPAPVTPTTPAQPVQLINVSGKASLGGVPLANATVKVFDALTNAPAAVIAAGGGNVIAAGGGNYALLQADGSPALGVGGASLTTDANGNFTVPLGNLQEGMVARIVVTAGEKTVTNLVTGSGDAIGSAPANYSVAQAMTAQEKYDALVKKGIFIGMDESTHVASQLMWGTAKLAALLKSIDRISLIQTSFKTINADILPTIKLKVDLGDANQFANTDEFGRIKDLKALDLWTKESGLTEKTTKVIDLARESVAKAVEKKEVAIQNVQLTNEDLTGSNITISNTGSNFTFKNDTTGESFTVSLPTGNDSGGQTGGETPTTSTNTSGGSSGPDPNVTPVVTSPNTFNPTVTATYTAGTPGVLSVSVSQPTGTEDIGAIYARLPKDKVTLATLGATLQAAGSQVDPDGAGPMAAVPLTITQDAGAASSVALPLRFSSATLSNSLWAGYIKNGSTNVATFQVFEYGAYYYLVTTYQLSSAVVTNGGHATTLTTNAIATLTAGSTLVEITLESRSHNKVDRAITL